jgi:large subunit ribosomal protein L2
MSNPAQFYAIIRRPVITEKSSAMQGMRNQFSFEVAASANKPEVKKAIEALFSVKVVSVNIANVPGKTRRTARPSGRDTPWACSVTLRKGDTIDVSRIRPDSPCPSWPANQHRRRRNSVLIQPLTRGKRRESDFPGRIACRTGGNASAITSRRGGKARDDRNVDFRRDKDGVPAVVAAIEYDPNRSADLALLHYADGEKRYILAPKGLVVGAKVMSGPRVEPDVGNATALDAIPLGLQVHNVELQPGRGGQLARSAGRFCQLMARDGDYAVVVLPSGEMRKIRAGAAPPSARSAMPTGRTCVGEGRSQAHPAAGATAALPEPRVAPDGRRRRAHRRGRHPCSPTGLLKGRAATRRGRRAASSSCAGRQATRRSGSAANPGASDGSQYRMARSHLSLLKKVAALNKKGSKTRSRPGRARA